MQIVFQIWQLWNKHEILKYEKKTASKREKKLALFICVS